MADKVWRGNSAIEQINSVVGKALGALMILAYAGRNEPRRDKLVWAKCACGNVGKYHWTNIRSGMTRSCGCMKHDVHTKHGLHKTAEYEIWKGMVARASRRDIGKAIERKHYADRGIFVCKEWDDSFKQFLADVGPRPSSLHSIERIDNEKGYEPGNVRWATHAEQMRNTRRTLKISLDGKTQCLMDWARELSVPVVTLKYRMKRIGLLP